MSAVASTPVNRTARQAKCRPTNGTLFSQLGIVAERDFEGCLRKSEEGRTAEVVIVLMNHSLWLGTNKLLTRSASDGHMPSLTHRDGERTHGLRMPVLALRIALCLRNSARRRASHGFS